MWNDYKSIITCSFISFIVSYFVITFHNQLQFNINFSQRPTNYNFNRLHFQSTSTNFNHYNFNRLQSLQLQPTSVLHIQLNFNTTRIPFQYQTPTFNHFLTTLFQLPTCNLFQIFDINVKIFVWCFTCIQ